MSTISYRMANPSYALDDFLFTKVNAGLRPSAEAKYRRELQGFIDSVPHKSTDEYVEEDYLRYLHRSIRLAPSTRASQISVINHWCKFLHKKGMASELYWFQRPKRIPYEDLPVVTISTEEAMKLMAWCEDIQEQLCVGGALFLGWRRAALNRARRADVDLVRGTMTVLEKGGKTVTKPVPDEYLALLRHAEASGVWNGPEDYLIPNRRPASMRRVGERSDKIIWDTVKRVAKRAGIRCHVHALRAAFAVAFEESHPGHSRALQDLLGHTRPETTAIYLRRRDKAKSMQVVRDLSWGLSIPEPNGPDVVVIGQPDTTAVETERDELVGPAGQSGALSVALPSAIREDAGPSRSVSTEVGAS